MMSKEAFMKDAIELIKTTNDSEIVKVLVNMFYHRLSNKNLIERDV